MGEYLSHIPSRRRERERARRKVRKRVEGLRRKRALLFFLGGEIGEERGGVEEGVEEEEEENVFDGKEVEKDEGKIKFTFFLSKSNNFSNKHKHKQNHK